MRSFDFQNSPSLQPKTINLATVTIHLFRKFRIVCKTFTVQQILLKEEREQISNRAILSLIVNNADNREFVWRVLWVNIESLRSNCGDLLVFTGHGYKELILAGDTSIKLNRAAFSSSIIAFSAIMFTWQTHFVIIFLNEEAGTFKIEQKRLTWSSLI